MAFDPDQFQILGRVALAMVLGALIGIDREAADKPAGLRTHMLVSGAAALLVALSDSIVKEFSLSAGTELFRADPIRVIEAVITGVSFLGAGTIIRQTSNGEVTGLTTAASILFSASVGIGVALSLWIVVGGATLLVLITLRVLPWIEYTVARRRQ
jgi:putative Mg2+ transporter-C (MgtC) family protein